MATKRKIYLPSIANLGASSAAGTVGQVDLPLYYKYHAIGLEYLDGGSSPTDITALIGDLAFKINADVKRLHTAAELDRLNSVNGTIYARQQIGAAALMKQVLVINFAEPWRSDKGDRIATAANLTPLFGVTSAQLSITLAAAMPSTGSLVVYAVVEAPDTVLPQSGPLTKQVLRQQIVVGGSSFDITTMDQTGYYQTVLMKHPTGACIAKATLKVNGTTFREIDRAANIAELIRNGMNPSTSTAAGAFGFELVLDDDDPINSALPAQGQNFVLHLDFNDVTNVNTSASASGTVTALIERVQFGW